MPTIPSRASASACLLVAAAMLASCTLTISMDLAGRDRSFTVYADRGWQDTGVSVQEGEEIILVAKSGRWFEDPPGVWHNASGGPDPWTCGDPSCHEPLPDQPKYALIGRIGEEGAPFIVGEFSRFFADSAGRLFLQGNYGDEDIPIHNPTGTVEVSIQYDQ